MKRYWKASIICIVVVLGIITISRCRNTAFEKNRFVHYTGVTEFILKINYHNNHESYIESLISNSNKRMLLKKFVFENNLLKIKGHIEPSFVTENENYLYNFQKDSTSQYGYSLLAIEKNGNRLIMYELYGD